MYIVLTQEEYGKLSGTRGMVNLFMDKLENEIKSKKEDIELYKRMGDKVVVNSLKYEYSGMLFVRDMFVEIMKV